MEYKRFKDVLNVDNVNPVPSWAAFSIDGVFTKLKTIAPWGDTVDEEQLNTLYASTRQYRIISELAYGVYFEMVYMPSGHTLSGGSNLIAEMAFAKYGEKWSRLWELRNTEYNPIENYNMTESGGDTNTRTGSVTRSDTGTVTDTHTGTDTLTKSGTETHTKAGEETLTKSGSETHTYSGKEKTTNTVTSNNTGTTNSVYGFNSSSAVPSDTSSGTQTGLSDSELEYTNRTDTDGFTNRVDTAGFNNRVDTDAFSNRQDQQTKNLTDQQTRNLSGSDTYNNLKDTGTHTLSRSGNIGVTTTQQMAESEIDLWSVFDYFEIVFKDIDSIMLLDIY